MSKFTKAQIGKISAIEKGKTLDKINPLNIFYPDENIKIMVVYMTKSKQFDVSVNG